MNSNEKPSLYFSAYPLKALNPEGSAKSSSGQSPYLKAILSGKTRSMSRVRVLPMINPYRQSNTPVMPRKDEKMPKDISLIQREWFNNYE